MDFGKISAVQAGSPADRENLRPGDRITGINGKAVGTDINPMWLPDHFSRLAGQEVQITVTRSVTGGEPEEETVTLTPIDNPSWLEKPNRPNEPLAIPSIGIAFHLIPVVLKVEADGFSPGIDRKPSAFRFNAKAATQAISSH